MTQSKTKALKEALNALVLNFNQVRIERSIGVLKGGPNTSYPCARRAQYNLIWVMREGNKGNKRILLQLGNNMGGYLFLLFLRLRGCMEGYK
jgi:hypothetical protein